jgi:hypothetical protein
MKKERQYTVGAHEAIALLRQHPVCTAYLSDIFWFTLFAYHDGSEIMAAGCPGEYPCCHDEMSVEQFLSRYKDDMFCVEMK